ncbi:hypothetical protein ABZY04_17330, partial [Streptomyces sp. NPDC002922]
VDNVTGSSSGDLFVAEDGGNMEICTTAAPAPAAAARTDRRPTGEELDVGLGLEELAAEKRDLRMRNSPCRNK